MICLSNDFWAGLAMHLTKWLQTVLHLMSRGVKQNIQLWNSTFWIANMIISLPCDWTKISHSISLNCTCNVRSLLKWKRKSFFFIQICAQHVKNEWASQVAEKEKKTKVDWMHEFVFMMCYNAFSITIIIYKSLVQLKGCVNSAHAFSAIQSFVWLQMHTHTVYIMQVVVIFVCVCLDRLRAAVLWSRELINWNCNKDRIYASPQVKHTHKMKSAQHMHIQYTRATHLNISPFHWLHYTVRRKRREISRRK